MGDEIKVIVQETDGVTATSLGVVEFHHVYEDASGSTVSKTAGEDIGGHRAISLHNDGQAYLTDISSTADAFKVLGVSTGAATTGSSIAVRTRGTMEESSWNWTPGELIYVGLSGILTQTPPAESFLLVLGTALSETTMYVNIQPPIFL